MMRSRHMAVLFALGVLTAAPFADLTLLRTLDLRADTHHVQGIDFDERRLWVTSVDKDAHKGYLQEFDLTSGEHHRTLDVTNGKRYHPGGLSADGESLWFPVAEYRRDSSSVIQKRSVSTLKLEFQFDVPDHIGCLAVVPDALIGANWDSRDFYVWDRAGRLLRKVANPTPNAYQDMKFVDGRLVASACFPAVPARSTGWSTRRCVSSAASPSASPAAVSLTVLRAWRSAGAGCCCSRKTLRAACSNSASTGNRHAGSRRNRMAPTALALTAAEE